MGTVIFLRGECEARKNNIPTGRMPLVEFSYDNDLRLFKLVARGDIWSKFGPQLVQRVVTQEVGSLLKKWQVSIVAKWPSGDEYDFVFKLSSKEQAENVKARVDGIVAASGGFDEVIRLLKTRERVPGSDVAALLSKFDLDATDQSVQRVVESAITSGQVEGVFDGKEFISKYGLQREAVRYDIVSKFEVNGSGAIVITCPKCGAAIPLQGKESNGNCRFCGTPYKVPKKILDML